MRGIREIAERVDLTFAASMSLLTRITAVFRVYFWVNNIRIERSLANGCWTACQFWVSMGGSPHSLGKSVEWKHPRGPTVQRPSRRVVPTRWGNQLNGNSY